MPTLRLTVPAELAGERLDIVVARLWPEVSRRAARRLVDDGAVYVDGKRVQVCSRAIKAGARVDLVTPAAERPDAPPPQILAIDDDLVVADKAAGVPTEPTREGSRGTLLAGLQDALRAQGLATTFLHAAHRLDTDTTGVVLFARTPDAAHQIGRQLQDGSAERRYLALVQGSPAWLRARLDAPLTKTRDAQGKIRVDDAGVEAVTLVTTLLSGTDAALVLCAPRTGRTHQLRVHLAHAGHPLVGDRRYGEGRAPHLGLHALSIALRHPRGDVAVRYVAPPPAALLAAAEAAGFSPAVVEQVVSALLAEGT